MGLARRIDGWISRLFGGRSQAQIILLLALVLALDSADLGAIGSMADVLQHTFGISKTKLGLLLTLSSAVSAVCTLVFGWLIDRSRRIRVLTVAILLWGGVLALCGTASSYTYLLVCWLALGAVIAAPLPAVASLVGDYFEPRDRGRVYGYILSGEFIGTGIGFILSGELAVLWWRLGFWSLAACALPLAWWVHRTPEPERGGASRMSVQQEASGAGGPGGGDERQALRRALAKAEVAPRERLVLDRDPRQRSLWWAIGYVVGIPTNLILILSSALGYYFLGGIRVFGVELMAGRFHLGHSASIWVLAAFGIGAIFGVYAGGALSDRLLARGHLRARVWVAAVCYLVSGFLFLLGLLIGVLWLAAIPFWLAACGLGAVNPPVDAARLDIMHPHLWGRAESIRVMLRKVAEAIAPVLFGLIADRVYGGGAAGLRATFFWMLIPLFAGGLIAFVAIRTYPRDVLSAERYLERTRSAGERG